MDSMASLALASFLVAKKTFFGECLHSCSIVSLPIPALLCKPPVSVQGSILAQLKDEIDLR